MNQVKDCKAADMGSNLGVTKCNDGIANFNKTLIRPLAWSSISGGSKKPMIVEIEQLLIDQLQKLCHVFFEVKKLRVELFHFFMEDPY